MEDDLMKIEWVVFLSFLIHISTFLIGLNLFLIGMPVILSSILNLPIFSIGKNRIFDREIIPDASHFQT
jgi:hypothetical protein